MHLGTIIVERIGNKNEMLSYYDYKSFSGLEVKHPVWLEASHPSTKRGL
jgi:hypothetical protein